MTYDFIAILDQDVPRCRSWVRFMGPKCRLSSLCSFRTLYFTPESGPATEGFSCRGAVMNDEGNAARKIRKL